MSSSRFKASGAPELFNKEQAFLILKDLVRFSVVEVSELWSCSIGTIYKIRNADYPYNYLLGTAVQADAVKKRVRNQEIILEKFAAGIQSQVIQKDLGMGSATVTKVKKLWTGMNDDERKPYYEAIKLEKPLHESTEPVEEPVEEPIEEPIEEPESQEGILSEEEQEALGNIMGEVQEEEEEVEEPYPPVDSNGDPLWDIEEEEIYRHDIMSFDENNISQQYIMYQKKDFQIWKIFVLPGFKEGDYTFLINGELQLVPEAAAEALIKGVPGIPTINFNTIRS